MTNEKNVFFRSLIIALTILLMTVGEKWAYGQTRTYLTGQKTGNYIPIGILGTGSSGVSSPMQDYSYLFIHRLFIGDAILNDNSVTTPSVVKASRAVSALNIVVSGSDTYIQFRTTGNTNLAANTTTYFKLGTKPVLSGIGVPLLGLLGLAELQNIKGVGYVGASNYVATFAGNENAGTAISTNTTKLLIDKDGIWYAAVTPGATYNSVRLNVAFPTDISVLDVGRELSANVYNAFTQTTGTCSSARAQFTDAGNATGITINTGALVGGLDLSQLVANPQYAINGSSSQYSTFSSGLASVGVASTISQTFYFDHSSTINEGASFRLGLPQSLIDLALLGNGISFKMYNGETLVGTQTLGTNILDLNLLNLVSLGSGYKELNVTVSPNVVFNKVVIELNAGLLNIGVLGDALRVYDVTMTAAKPTFTSPISSQNVSICTGNSAALKATTDSGNELLWYDSQTSTSPTVKAYNETYTTPALTSNTTYYVASRKTGCTYESERVPVNVTVNPKPPSPHVNISSN